MNDEAQSKFDTLYAHHFKMLISKIFQVVGCRRVAEDLAQEAYLRVSATLVKRQVDYLRPYLYQTAHNLALDHLRKETVRKGAKADQFNEAITSPDDLPSNMPGPEQSAISMQKIRRLQTALAALPERRREILLLHKVHHWRYKDIAKHLEISVSAVEKNIQLALAHCMKIQEDEKY